MGRTKPTQVIGGKNAYPDILTVDMVAEFCDDNQCQLLGAVLVFQLDFKTRPINRNGHNLEIGLRGGQLVLDLDGRDAAELLPQQKLDLYLPRKQTTERSRTGQVGVKGPTGGAGQKKAHETESRFCQIRRGGTHSGPHWKFRPGDGELLEGFTNDIQVHFPRNSPRACTCGFAYKTVDDDWDYRVDVRESIFPGVGLIARLKLHWNGRAIANHYRETCNNTPSYESWACPSGGAA